MSFVCIKCGRKLPKSSFPRDSSARDKIKHTCRACYNNIRKTYPSYSKKSERK